MLPLGELPIVGEWGKIPAGPAGSGGAGWCDRIVDRPGKEAPPQSAPTGRDHPDRQSRFQSTRVVQFHQGHVQQKPHPVTKRITDAAHAALQALQIVKKHVLIPVGHLRFD